MHEEHRRWKPRAWVADGRTLLALASVVANLGRLVIDCMRLLR